MIVHSKLYFNKFYILLFLVALISCHKDQELFVPSSDGNDKVNFFSQLDLKPKQYIVNIEDKLNHFISDNGSIIEIPSGSLLKQNNEIFIGKAILQFKEINKLSDFLIHQKHSIYKDNFLQTSQLIYVQFLAEGQPLTINAEKPITIKTINDKPLAGLDFFSENIVTQNQIEWVKDQNNTKVSSGVWSSSIGEREFTELGYSFSTAQTGWLNLAKLVDFHLIEKTPVCLDIEEAFNVNNSYAYLILEQTNSIIPLNVQTKNINICSVSENLPQGANVKFIIISYQNNQKHYFGMTNAILKNNHLEKINPALSSFEEILQIIQSI